MTGGMVIDVVWARGHSKVTARHRSTLEVTTDDYVTERGDCIIACCADKAAADLNESFKRLITSSDYSLVIMVIVAGSEIDVVTGLGVKGLRLRDGRRIIARRSAYIDDATLMILANKAAGDLSRSLINRVKANEPVAVVLIGAELE